MFLKLIGVVFLVGTNGFFVASEFSLVSVRRARIEARAAAGSKNARAALRLLRQPHDFYFRSAVWNHSRFTGSGLDWRADHCRVARPLASTIASEGRAGYLAHMMAIVIAFSIISFLHIVLGELMPKMIALERAEPIALFSADRWNFSRVMFSAPLWFFNSSEQSSGD